MCIRDRSIISIALIFGAPDTVPAGNPDHIVSNFEYLLLNTPSTIDTICMT